MKEGAITNRLDLHYLDESGFAPTLPTSYTWAREGVRPRVPYEAPEGRRVNVIGAVAPLGDAPRLCYTSRTTGINGSALLSFIWRDIAGMLTPVGEVPVGYQRVRPCVIVMDNYSVHRSKAIKEHLPALEAAGIVLFYLPPYSPELNLIEPLWRHVKHEDMPLRSYTSVAALQAAVNTALDKRSATFHLSTINLTKAA